MISGVPAFEHAHVRVKPKSTDPHGRPSNYTKISPGSAVNVREARVFWINLFG
jgi:hypothetical protein